MVPLSGWADAEAGIDRAAATATANKRIIAPSLSLESVSAATLALSRWRRPLGLIVEMVRSHRPRPLVVPGRIGAVALHRVAVDERSQEQGMGNAAHLVLDRIEEPAAVGVDDVAEAVLILVVLAIDELAEPAVRAGEIDDVDLHVMFVELGQRPVGLAEDQMLVLADLHARHRAVAVRHGGRRADIGRVERRDAVR